MIAIMKTHALMQRWYFFAHSMNKLQNLHPQLFGRWATNQRETPCSCNMMLALNVRGATALSTVIVLSLGATNTTCETNGQQYFTVCVMVLHNSGTHAFEERRCAIGDSPKTQ